MDFDLNVDPNLSVVEMPPSNKFFFDLNNEPYEENDTPIEEGLYQLVGVSYQMEEDPNPSEEGSQMEDETINNAGILN